MFFRQIAKDEESQLLIDGIIFPGLSKDRNKIPFRVIVLSN